MARKKKRHVARSAEDKARKRDAILDAAMRLLVTKGYSNTTMSHVAREADIGRGTVYWHFESKNDLFFSLLEREVGKFDEGFSSVAEVDAPAIVKLESIIRAAFQLYGDAPNMFRAFMSVLTGADEEMERKLMELFTSMYGKYNGLIEGLLEKAKDEGDVRSDLDSRVVAAAIVVMLDALFLQIYFGLLENEPERLGDSIVSALRNGYAARPGDPGGCKK